MALLKLVIVAPVLALVALVLAPLGEAIAETLVPQSARSAVERSCSAPVVSTAGPWTTKGRRVVAGIAWAEGSKTACFAVVDMRGTGTRTTSRITAKTSVDAGYSARYDELYAPGLQTDIVRFPDGTIAIVVDTAQMNPSGGGGTETSLWRLNGSKLTNVFAEILDSSTTINEATESPCPGGGPLRISTVKGVWTLRVNACSNGVVTEQIYRFNGKRFTS